MHVIVSKTKVILGKLSRHKVSGLKGDLYFELDVDEDNWNVSFKFLSGNAIF